ncbi:MAG: asparagine synthase (glutamine-hydrolyzing) [Deltaproteobacteria bacterium]|nr:asparagine synthase (glutamine-hydrolyzing) [Deltaproteobacteria bacterium]
MCGIVGVFGGPKDTERVPAMAQLCRHRGPDDFGLHLAGADGPALALVRLAILDLSPAGHQPMLGAEGQVVLAFNGEIYNFESLRAQLQSHGCAFTSSSDTEVLLRGYETWGESVLDRVLGMFAFALWDGRTRTLLLARDATGIKPLFYRPLPSGGLAFASEAKAFAAFGPGSLEPDDDAVRQYVEFGYVWDYERSMFREVRKVPPGHLLRVRDGHLGPAVRWWQIPTNDVHPVRGASDDETEEDLWRQLDTATREHLVADVPVGLLLSGGLDSSVLAAIASRHTPEPLRTIGVGFEGFEPDERPYSRQVAAHLGTRHSELVLTAADVLTEFEQSAWYYDDLFWDTGFVTSMVIYRRCREKGLKVVLVGEGADEIFGGYRNFDLLSRPAVGWLPDVVHRYLFFRQYSGQQWGTNLTSHLKGIAGLHAAMSGDWFHTVRAYELMHQIPNNLNMKVDRASMAASVEARVPFQDRRVVEAACRMPRTALLRNGTNKWMLRHLARKRSLLPSAIIDRPKLGMLMPPTWLTADPVMRRSAKDRVLAPGSWAERLCVCDPVARFFDGRADPARRFFRKYLAYSTLSWRLFVLELWREAYSPASVAQRLESARATVLSQVCPAPHS